jgi:hypothetical protein
MQKPDVALLFPSIQRPKCKVILVSGPPGSGKSFYVRQHAKQSDVVIDLDEIIAEISGEELYGSRSDALLTQALLERNRRLSKLSEADGNTVAWVIACAPGDSFAWWRRALYGPRVVSIVPPKWKCEEQIKADQRRSADVSRHLKACSDWYERNAHDAQRRRNMTSSARGSEGWHGGW